MSHGYNQSWALAVALGSFLQVSGCLNPRPEELPSNGPAAQLPGNERETCEDNPLLGGCELPASDIDGDPSGGDLGGEADEESPALPAAPSDEPEAAGAAAGDAGTAEGADAGGSDEAPDAGAPQ